MLTISAQKLAEVVDGRLVSGPADVGIKEIVIDSRGVQPGCLFAAFVGEQVDGHDYIPQAIAKGAAAILVSRENIKNIPVDVAVIVVTSPLAAIQALASYERTQFSGPVIAVTGSNGKTTTKEMLKTVFSTKGACLATRQNQNNELGLPLTLLRHQPSDTSIVLEMGMRARGEIDQLSRFARPTTGIITNIGHSHLELLGSQEQIALAKTELLHNLPANGFAILHGDDPWLRKLASTANCRVMWFGFSPNHDAWADHISFTNNVSTFTAHILGRSIQVTLPALGRHNVLNALAALLAGAVNGLDLQTMVEALYQISSTSGRLHQVQGRMHRTIIDDCYNASPSSMKASLGVLAEMSKATGAVSAAVLGDMYELGAYEEEGHTEVGRYCAETGINHLIAVGEKARWIAAGAKSHTGLTIHYYTDKTALVNDLDTLLPPGAIVLVKASRGMKLEDVVSALSEQAIK